jgi:S-adenosylmethionine:tRNA ribosyltransferase-isomerase
MTDPLHDIDQLETYSYELPEELIAKEPTERRDGARMLVVHRDRQTIEHRTIRDLPEYLRPGDCLVLNDTRVVPARLIGKRSATGGRWEGLFLRTIESGQWELIGQTRGRLQPGELIELESIHHAESERPLSVRLVSRDDEGTWTAQPQSDDSAFELLQRYGTVPLPPYIQRSVASDADRERYQTTYASVPGSVAAPTAGLHFTSGLLNECRDRGATEARVTLHVGIGTFRPVSVACLSAHRMHSEFCVVSEDVASQLRHIRQSQGRIIGVGTTSVRSLETAARSGQIDSWSGETDLFIRPPYDFRAVDCLLTNFHLPKSTLFVLVCALAGTELAHTAYRTAIEERYRFFSYGDAMLIV